MKAKIAVKILKLAVQNEATTIIELILAKSTNQIKVMKEIYHTHDKWELCIVDLILPRISLDYLNNRVNEDIRIDKAISAIEFEYGDSIAKFVRIFNLCPKFKDRYQIIEKEHARKN